jgi:hypothetical protein
VNGSLGTTVRIAEALDYLSELARSQADTGAIDFERLAAGYAELRRTLAKEFRTLAQQELLSGESALEVTRQRIEYRMQQLYGGRIPDKYLSVRGYTGVHPILLEYLLKHAGTPVAASRLRLLTGDQVHTERRLRELRDLGYELSWRRMFEEDHYVLASSEPAIDVVARSRVEHNIREDRSVSTEVKAELLGRLGDK